jgi:hypothetical protein
VVLLELAELPAQVANPLGSPRVTLIGSVGRIPEPELTAVRMAYLKRYLHRKYLVDFDDLFSCRIGVLDVGIGAQEAEMTSVDRLGLHLLGNGRSRNHGRAANHIKPAWKSPQDCLRWHAILICVP